MLFVSVTVTVWNGQNWF